MPFALDLGERNFRTHCALHQCDLVENEHYDDWFFGPDFSGFYCPVTSKIIEEATNPNVDFDCSEYWRVSPIGHDEIDIHWNWKKVS